MTRGAAPARSPRAAPPFPRPNPQGDSHEGHRQEGHAAKSRAASRPTTTASRCRRTPPRPWVPSCRCRCRRRSRFPASTRTSSRACNPIPQTQETKMNQAEVTKFPAPSEADTATVEAAAGGNGCDAESIVGLSQSLIAGLRQPRGLHLPRDRARGREQQLASRPPPHPRAALAQPFPWSAHACRHRIPGRDPHLRVPVLHGAHRFPRCLAHCRGRARTSSSWARSSSSPSRRHARRRAGPAQVLPRGTCADPCRRAAFSRPPP